MDFRNVLAEIRQSLDTLDRIQTRDSILDEARDTTRLVYSACRESSDHIEGHLQAMRQALTSGQSADATIDRLSSLSSELGRTIDSLKHRTGDARSRLLELASRSDAKIRELGTRIDQLDAEYAAYDRRYQEIEAERRRLEDWTPSSFGDFFVKLFEKPRQVVEALADLIETQKTVWERVSNSRSRRDQVSNLRRDVTAIREQTQRIAHAFDRLIDLCNELYDLVCLFDGQASNAAHSVERADHARHEVVQRALLDAVGRKLSCLMPDAAFA